MMLLRQAHLLQIPTLSAMPVRGEHACQNAERGSPDHLANKFLQFSGCTVEHVCTLTRPTGPWQSFARKQRNASLILRKGLAVTADAAQHPRPGPQQRPEAVVVLGGGLTTQGGIPPWGQRRLDKAIQIYRQPGEVFLLILASTLWQHMTRQLKFTVACRTLRDLVYGSVEFSSHKYTMYNDYQ